MARAYLARDLEHSRSVAVKGIRPDPVPSLGMDRLLPENEIDVQRGGHRQSSEAIA